MKALARPRSLAGNTSMAMPSTATSCAAANTLTTRPATINTVSDQPSKPSRGSNAATAARARNDATNPPWASSTQGRRKPIVGNPKRSISGPASSLKAHGSVTTPVNPAIVPTLASRSASHAGIATDSKPMGTPCAK